MEQQKVGRFLKELRKEKQLTQEQLGAEFNVSSRTVSRWETGRNLPDISMLTDIADFFDVDVRELIEGERKSEMMDKEIKEVAQKMADYAEHEKSRLLKIIQVVSFFGVLASLLSIYLQTAGKPGEATLQTVDAVAGSIQSKWALNASLIALIAMTVVTLYVTGILEKILKHRVLFCTIKVVSIAALVYGILRILLFTSLFGILMLGSVCSRVSVHDDPTEYSEYIHNPENDDYLRCDGPMFEIMPKRIADVSKVSDYQCTYYNPWDPQYVVYLTEEFEGSAYADEIARLEAIGVEDYLGLYCVTGEPAGYDIIAMDSDEYYGFVYAMVPESGEQKITYVAVWFCNYFLDLDVHDYIPDAYLLPGFDATDDNPYREKMLGRPTD